MDELFRNLTLRERSVEPNQTLFQAFEWYSPSGSQHWRHLQSLLPKLAQLGVSSLWLPPGCKAGSRHSNGYDLYDLYDLGEFEQKDTRPTKWGSKEDLVALIETSHLHGVKVYWDAVLSHRAAADYKESCWAAMVDPYDRRRFVSEAHEIEAWVGFDYQGRGGTHSSMRYNAAHFNGVDYDAKTGQKGIYLLLGNGEKYWARDVDKEKGNYDYLLCANVDLSRVDVRQDLFQWSQWIVKELNLDGFRLDAMKHTSRGFIKDFMSELDPNMFVVGEYATADPRTLQEYVQVMDGRMSLFDFALHSNFVRTSKDPNSDLREIFKDTLVQQMPGKAVTFVTNHDTQDRQQGFDTTVAPFFIPLAYALILLTTNTGYPCVFYGDLLGVQGPKDPPSAPCGRTLAKIMLARKLFAYGKQQHYFSHNPHCIGFVRTGDASVSGGAGLAVVLNKAAKFDGIRMNVGRSHAGELWTDILETVGASAEVAIDSQGWGNFSVGPSSAAIWANVQARGRPNIDDMDL